MNVPKFNDREKALEDEYIRRKEAEKFKAQAPQPGGSSAGKQVGTGAATTSASQSKDGK